MKAGRVRKDNALDLSSQSADDVVKVLIASLIQDGVAVIKHE